MHGRVRVFLDEKEFYGCGGMQVTEEVMLTVAGNACILLLGMQRLGFPGFTSILVYPDTYVARQASFDGTVMSEELSVRAGESWHRGPVILSWADVVRGVGHGGDGHNVVIHEFAHKLDEENDTMDGLPVLHETADYPRWARVLTREYQLFQERVVRGENTVLDSYGAVSPPEFFAVATESFFEKGAQMRAAVPDLYAQLQSYYRLDPAAWTG